MNLLCRVKHVLKTDRQPARGRAWFVGVLAVAIPLVVVPGFSGIPGTHSSAVAQQREGSRSPEADAGPRQAAEQEGQVRSAESAATPRRSAEREAGAGRSAEAAGRELNDNSLRGFKPQTDREAALYQMIVQLRSEMSALRREVRSRGDGDGASRSEIDSNRPVRDLLSARWQNTKDGKVFKAYDKNGDQFVSLDEWLAMTNGNVNSARREMQTHRFHEAEPSGDGKFTPAEFIHWYSVARHNAVEGSRGARDGDVDSAKRGPRDGEGVQRGPRDGEGVRRGPRDGEGVRRGPRDGETEKSGPRDGDRQ